MSTEIATISSTYAVLKSDPEELRSVLAANVGDGGLGAFELDRVRVPAGGGKAWEVPGLDGSDTIKEIEGVIVAWRDARAYWQADLDASGGGTPPDCSSSDGVRGVGDPGGVCMACPMAQFGSATKAGKQARGQACKQTRMLFMVRPGDSLPIVVVAPPSSLKAVKQYFLRLASQAIPFYGVVTALGLEPDKSKDGITYSKVAPKLVSRLEPAERERMNGYAQAIAVLVNKVTVESADIHGAE